MVAIFTGLGSGFERGSAAALGARGLLGSSSLGRGGEGVFLNAASGNLVITQEDEFLVGRGPDISIARTYNSLGSVAHDDNQDLWRQSSDRRVMNLTGTANTSGSTVERLSADGSVIVYTWQSGGSYITTEGAGAHDKLTYDGTYWTWTDGDSRITEKYEADGAGNWRIVEQRDPDGQATTFTYTTGKLTRIATQDGSYIDYTWSGSNITSVVTGFTDLVTSTAKTITRTSYTYDANRLATVTVDLTPENTSDSSVYTTTYTYHGSSKRIASITQSDNSSLAISYDGSDRVSSLVQTAASGDTRTTTIAYFSDRTEITDPRGQVTKLYFNASGQLTQVVAPPAFTGATAQSIAYAYDSAGNLETVTDAAGVTTYAYDANGNITSITAPNSAVTTRAYNSLNQLTRETRTGSYADGTASLHTRLVYNGAGQLRYAVSAEGRVSEYVYNGLGQLAQTNVYTDDVYPYPNDTSPSDNALDTWRDGLSDLSNVEITVHTYDARGALASTKRYGSAHADTGAAEQDEGYSERTYVYDQAGLLRERRTLPHNTEVFVYDGLGRVILQTDLSGGTTKIAFNDAANQTVVTTLAVFNSGTQSWDASANSYVSTSTYNKAGDLLSVADSGFWTAAGTRSYAYDKNGQLRMATDASTSARKSYVLYDKAGRKIADIGHDGQLTEYQYDAAGRLVAIGRYTGLVAAEDITALANPTSELEITDIRPAADNRDIWEWTIYDAAGRVIETILGDSVTAYEYDAANRLVKTLGYYNKLTSTQVTNFIAAPPTAAVLPTAHAKDTVERSFYDRDGRLIGALNGEGGLSQIVYDAAGRKIQEIAYAALTSTTYRASGTFNQLLGSITPDAAKDASVRYVYDAQGQLRFTIDAIGRVSELVYWSGTQSYANGLVRKSIVYATPLASVANYKYGTIKTAVAALAGANDRASYNVYNAKGQLAYAVSALGAVTGFAYDGAGRLIKTTQFAVLANMSSMGTEAQWQANLDTWAASNGADARITRDFRTARGEVRFSVDAEGYVTGTTFDGEGRAHDVSRYDVKVSADDSWTASTVWNAVASAGSVLTKYRYDNMGRLKDIYDGNGARSYFSYYANGTQLYANVAHGQTGQVSTRFDYNRAGQRIKQRVAYGTADEAATDYAYDGLGNLISVTDALSNVTTYTYDKAGRILTETNAASGVTTYEYDALGRGVKITDPRGNASYSYYDALGRITLSIDAEGYATQTSYTAFGEIASVTRRYTAASGAAVGAPPSITTNSLDATTTFSYDKLARTTRVTDALGAYEEYTLNAFGDRIAVRNKLGGTTSYVHDKRGFVISETLPVKAYDSAGAEQISSVTASAFITNRYDYDERGNRVRAIEGLGFGPTPAHAENALRTTIYEYDGANNLLRVIGEAQDVAASSTANTSSVTPTQHFFYDNRRNIIEKRDEAGAKTFYWYDALDRVSHEISATGTLKRFFYDDNSNLIEARTYATQESLPADATGTPPAGTGAYRATLYTYDALNRVTQVKTQSIKTGAWDPALATPAFAIATGDLVTTYEYDAMGNVVRTTDANGSQTYAYFDKLGRKLHQVDAGLYRTTWTYNSDGNVLSERRYATQGPAPSGTTTPPAAPANHADDRITTFTYDKLGQRLSETREAVKAHNGAGAHVTQNAFITYTYNALGQVASKAEATGDAITYSYDVSGRMTQEQRSQFSDVNGNNVTPTIQYAYNGLSNLSRVRALGAGGTIAAADRITTYAYGVGGRLQSVTDAEGFVRAYVYDAAGRVMREEYNRITIAGTADEAMGYDYDLEGRITTQGNLRKISGAWTRSNIVSGLGDTIDEVTTQYNAFGEVAQRGQNGVYAEQFAYDAAGRLIRTNAGDGVWKYFLYDKAGNQTLMIATDGSDFASASLDTLDEVLALWANPAAIGATNVAGVTAAITRYDARGQAILVLEPQRKLTNTTTADLRTSRAYNAFGEVIRETNANGHDGSGNPITTASIEYAYNTMGRLIQTTSPAVEARGENGNWITGYSGNTPNASSATATTFRPIEHRYYDLSGRLVASRDANGNLTKLSLLAGSGYGGAEALVSVTTTPDSATVTTGYDIHGDARKITDQLNRVTTQAFDGLGRLTQLTSPGGLIEYFAYDGLGQRKQRYNSLLGVANVETTTYDQQGRITQHVAMGGDVTSYTYGWSSTLATAGMGTFGGWTKTTTFANSKTLIDATDAFGRTTVHTNMSNVASTHTYDKAGRLVQRTGAIALNFDYFNTGRVKETYTMEGTVASQNWNRRGTNYGYDALGNVISETTVSSGQTHVWVPGYNTWEGGEPTWHPGHWSDSSWYNPTTNMTASYDALGRMTSWSEAGTWMMPVASVTYAYDANGNIRRSNSSFRTLDALGNASATPATQDYWYRFDSLNRVVTAKGILSGGAIVRGSGGVDYGYDYAGQRVFALSSAGQDNFTYDPEGRLAQVHKSGVLRAAFGYDLMGRMTSQYDYDVNGVTVLFSRAVAYNSKSQVTSDTTDTKRGSIIYRGVSSYNYGAGASYALGSPNTVTTVNYENGVQKLTNLTTNTYAWHENAVTSQIAYKPDINQSTTNTTTYGYTDIGGLYRLESASIVDGRQRGVVFWTEFSGQTIRRDEGDYNSSTIGDPHEIWYRFAGKQIGYVGNNGTLDTDYAASIANRTVTPGAGQFRFGATTHTSYADFDQSLAPINSYYQGATSGSAYVVRAGDTLSSIAANLWGDASLWWKLAEANGLSGAAALSEGQTLIVPAGVVKSGHSAKTFTPYDPNEILGDTAPTTPIQPKPKKNKCGALGQVLLVVIAVAVTVITKNFVLGEKILGSAFLANAGAAAAGSIVSQGVGVATGIQAKFSWNAVGLAALGGGIGGSGIGDKFAKSIGVVGGAGQAAVAGAFNNALTQGIGVATGLQKEFSWAGVAAAGVGAAVFDIASNRLPGGAHTAKVNGQAAKIGASWSNRLGASMASTVADAAARSLIEGSDFSDNIMAALPNVIGQTIGEAIAGGIARAGRAEPIVAEGSGEALDGFALRYGDADRAEVLADAEAEIRELMALGSRTEDQAIELQAAMVRYELAAERPGDLRATRLIPDGNELMIAEAMRRGADDLATSIASSRHFAGVDVAGVLAHYRDGPAGEAFGAFMDHVIAVASLDELPGAFGASRSNLVRSLGYGLSRAKRDVEGILYPSTGIFDNPGTRAYRGFNQLSGALLANAEIGVSRVDLRSAQAGMTEYTGRAFYTDYLAAATGGALVGALRRYGGLAARDVVSNLTPRGTFSPLRPGAVLPRSWRTLVPDDAGRLRLRGADGSMITPTGRYDFVTMPDGTIRMVRPNSNASFSTHLSLSGGSEVRYAGEVRFNNRGVVLSWNNRSGHYLPPPSYADRAGLPTDVFQPYRPGP